MGQVVVKGKDYYHYYHVIFGLICSQAVASRGTEQQHTIDLLEDIIAGIFEAADVNQQGYLSREDYIQVCQLYKL